MLQCVGVVSGLQDCDHPFTRLRSWMQGVISSGCCLDRYCVHGRMAFSLDVPICSLHVASAVALARRVGVPTLYVWDDKIADKGAFKHPQLDGQLSLG